MASDPDEHGLFREIKAEMEAMGEETKRTVVPRLLDQIRDLQSRLAAAERALSSLRDAARAVVEEETRGLLSIAICDEHSPDTAVEECPCNSCLQTKERFEALRAHLDAPEPCETCGGSGKVLAKPVGLNAWQPCPACAEIGDDQ